MKENKDEKVDIAQALLENPTIQKIVDKMFFKKTVKYGLIMACLTAGIFSVVNGLIIGLNLGWVGWVTFGSVLSFAGGFYTIKQLWNKNG